MTAEFTDHTQFKETHGSIAETGAQIGERVVCCSVRDSANEGGRYTVGRIYRVVKNFRSVGVEGNAHGKDFGDTGKWLLPFAGFGAQWAKV